MRYALAAWLWHSVARFVFVGAELGHLCDQRERQGLVQRKLDRALGYRVWRKL
jgi:hypothetical protein